MRLSFVISLLFVIFFPMPSYAYVGPGLGLGAFGVITGIIVSVFLAIVGLFWYPVKRLLKKLKQSRK